MQEFACKNIGLECSYRTTGMTKEDAVKKASEHAMKVHADVLKGMTREQSAQFMKKVEDSLRPV